MNNNNDDAMSITEISFQPKDLDDYYLDRQLDDIRKALSVIRKDRSTATKVFQREQTARNLHIAKMKVDKLLKRGRDAGVYNRAIQDLYSCNSTGTSTVSPNNTLPPQYVLQRQAMVLQILHKTDLYQHQCTVIQQHSNQLVSYIMCQAAVIEAEKRRFREELLLQPVSFINDFAVQLERSHQTRASVQTNVMEHLQMRVSTIVEGEREGEETATKPWIRKDRSSSLGTNDTLMDDTVSVDSTCETTTTTTPPNKELTTTTKTTSSLFNLGKLLKLY